MGRLGDWLDVFEVEITQKLRNVIESDGGRLVDADEVSFFGVPKFLPPSMEYLHSIGTPVLEAEIYLIAIKNGKLIGPETWYAGSMRDRLEGLVSWMREKLATIIEICDEEGFNPPYTVKTAVVIDSEDTYTKYEFTPLPHSPVEWATAADLAFDAWVQ